MTKDLFVESDFAEMKVLLLWKRILCSLEDLDLTGSNTILSSKGQTPTQREKRTKKIGWHLETADHT